jgi:hypothetical protein
MIAELLGHLCTAEVESSQRNKKVFFFSIFNPRVTHPLWNFTMLGSVVSVLSGAQNPGEGGGDANATTKILDISGPTLPPIEFITCRRLL